MDAELQPDSLDGWVAIKENVFGQPEAPHKLRFLVAWNAVESKFAVTCHNRTLQEQAGDREGAPAEDGAEQPSWAGLYSSQALQGVHRQLAALNERLEPCFPALPPALTGHSGLWALLFPGCPVLEEAELEALCRCLERYLGWALELCGRKALLDTLFAQDQDEEDEYFENLQEFRRKALKGQLTGAKEALRRVQETGGLRDGRGRGGARRTPAWGRSEREWDGGSPGTAALFFRKAEIQQGLLPGLEKRGRTTSTAHTKACF